MALFLLLTITSVDYIDRTPASVYNTPCSNLIKLTVISLFYCGKIIVTLMEIDLGFYISIVLNFAR